MTKASDVARFTSGIDSTSLSFSGDVNITGIGTTSPTSKLHVVGDGNFTGIVTASSFNGSLTGTATTATNLTDAANITTGTINSARLSGTYNINVSYATTAGIATVAQGLTGTPNINVGVITATSLSIGGNTVTTAGVGIATAGGTVGTGVTLLDLRGAGISTVTVSSGIATLNITGGGGLTISDDTSTNATRYIVFDDATSGSVSAANVSSTKLTFNPSTGTLTTTSLVESSSITLKENINPIKNALDLLIQLNPVTYDRKDGPVKNEAGLIAEEVNNILPSIVTKDESGNPQGINYTKLSVYLIDAIKTLKEEINSLKGI